MNTAAAHAPISLPIIGQATEERSRDLILKTSSNELIFAVVGHVGSGTSYVAKALKVLLEDTSLCGEPFEVHILKARSVIEDWAKKHNKDTTDLAHSKTLKCVEKLQDFGDEMRDRTSSGKEDHAAVARALVLQIRKTRAKSMGIAPSSPLPAELDRKRRAYIIDSLRHPEEAHLFRRLYQDAFIQIGIVCEESRRLSRLVEKYADAGAINAKKVMRRDEDDLLNKNGQHVGDTFYLSDFFIDNTANQKNSDGASNESWTINDELSRLIKLLIGRELVRPYVSETAMNTSHSAKLRSACLSRQVGAAIIDREGQLIATGTNEVPKAGGGLYGEQFEDDDASPEGRCGLVEDSKNHYCRNTREQNEIIAELIEDIPELKALSEERKKALKVELRLTRIGQLLEFSRAVHAEMDAILSAARGRSSVVGGRMFVTTFPCHNCARHLVAAGIDEVQYIEPYPKSHALDLHRDSIDPERTATWIPPSKITGKENPRGSEESSVPSVFRSRPEALRQSVRKGSWFERQEHGNDASWSSRLGRFVDCDVKKLC